MSKLIAKYLSLSDAPTSLSKLFSNKFSPSSFRVVFFDNIFLMSSSPKIVISELYSFNMFVSMTSSVKD